MATASIPITKDIEPALRLSEVLNEEYDYIHGPTAGATQSASKVELVMADKLIEKLSDERRKNQQRSPDQTRGQMNDLRELTTAKRVDVKTPYTHLERWLKDKPFTEEAIRDVLAEKAKDEDSTLLTNEKWLLDSAICPYTRGLVKRYREQLKQNATHTPDANTEELRQLLLEDAFVDHIKPQENNDLSAIFKKMLRSNQAALCLSGGGIRSATFGLGIVQGLARHGLLGQFKYLSTVSGGGYLGGWLSAWSHQEGFDQVITKLKPSGNTPIATEADPIHHLRQYSNYLSPQLGLFSADTWTLIATYFRNLLLIWLVILPFLAALAAAPWVMVNLASYKLDHATSHDVVVWVIGLLLLLAAGLAIWAIRYVHAYIPTSLDQNVSSNDQASPKKDEPQQERPTVRRDQAAFITNCLAPFSVAILILMLVWKWGTQLTTDFADWGVFYVIGSTALAHLLGWFWAKPVPKSWWLHILMGLAIAVVGACAGWLLLKTATLMPADDVAVFVCLSFPLFQLAILLSGYIFEGVISHYVPDARREWTARYSAWLLIVGVGWLILTSAVMLGSRLLETIGELQLATGVGLGSGILTALLGGSSKTAGQGQGAGSRHGKGSAPGLFGLLANFTLPITATLTLFMLLVLLSRFDLLLIDFLTTKVRHNIMSLFWEDILTALLPLVVLGCLAGVGYLVATLVDTNQFSLHAMYRARLVRAYLGASRPQSMRKPDPFTGFDENDDLPMSDLRRKAETPTDEPPKPKPPFHLVNIALNLVGGQNLAWQERKAESFSVSPLHAGALNLGYRRTYVPHSENVEQDTGLLSQKKYGCYGGGSRGISLGTAVTISGAAASPNMGYHSSPLIAFLMTLFNVRLGWWLGNPGPAGDHTFDLEHPSLAVRPIWDELVGKTDDVNDYVYLSDGGHFENLGLYEMVLRRNRFIVVSDAGCDEKCELEDLGNAIRKIRIDLGIPIDFPPEFKIHARSHKLPVGDGQYWALGRIHYSAVDGLVDGSEDQPDATDGILLYIKPGIYGNEPRDVFNYAAMSSAFPHESTADQFFTESQFESYRALGLYVLETIVDTCQGQAGIPLADFFKSDGPKQHWVAMKKQQEAEEKKKKETKEKLATASHNGKHVSTHTPPGSLRRASTR
jgi:hypothetical protein